MRRALLLPALLALLVSLSGCATSGGNRIGNAEDTVDVIARVQDSTANLLANTRGLDPDQPVVVATFVNVDDLHESSTFGRTLAELFASSLTRAGVDILEVRMRQSLFIEESTGELMLSRDIRRLSASHNAQAILVGTYGRGRTTAYVNVRLVRTRDNRVLGAASTAIPLDRNTRAMLPAQW